MANFLQTLFDASIPGQRINAAREQRAQRIAAREQRERDAQAFEAIRSGDVMGAAAYSPEIAGQYQGVQQQQKTFDTAQDDASSQRFRDAGLRAARAGKALVAGGVDPVEAFDRITSQAGNLFGSPEELEQFRSFVAEGGQEAYNAIEAAFTGNATDKGRYISTRGGIFDTRTREIIANTDPLDDLKRQKIQSEIGATDALRDQRLASANEKPAAVTKGQEALDKAFAKEAVDFLQGGASVAAANIARLDNAVEALETENITGPIAGFGDVNVRSITSPRSAAVQQQVQNAIQESLKATLGAQFARVEGEQLLDRAFAPRQQEGENIRRVKIVADMARDMLSRKQEMVDYFLENGTMSGYAGEPPDVEGFIEVLREMGDDGKKKGGLSPEKQRRLDELRAKRDAGTLQ